MSDFTWLLCDSLAGFLVLVLLQTTFLIAVGFLLIRLPVLKTAAGRHGIWLAALISVLLSPVVTAVAMGSGFAFLRIPVPWTSSKTPGSDGVSSRDLKTGTTTGETVRAEPNRPAAVATPFTVRPPQFGAWFVGAWFVGVGVMLLRLLHGFRLTRNLLRSSRRDSRDEVASLSRKISRELGLAGPVPVYCSPAVVGPCAFGLLRPVVIVPCDVVARPRTELEAILIHEIAHVARRDPMVGFLQRLSGVVHWYHPLVILMNRGLSRAREELCDNHVLERIDRVVFSRALLALSDLDAPPAPRASLAIFPPRWNLESRIGSLLNESRSLETVLNRRVAVLVAAIFFGLSAAAGGISLFPASESYNPGATRQPISDSLPPRVEAPPPGGEPVILYFDHENERFTIGAWAGDYRIRLDGSPAPAHRFERDGVTSLFLNRERLVCGYVIVSPDGRGGSVGTVDFTKARWGIDLDRLHPVPGAGLRFEGVPKGSALGFAGVKPGAILKSVAGRRIFTRSDVIFAIVRGDALESLSIRIHQGGVEQNRVLRILR